MNKGVWYAAGAYTMWGFLPIYLKTVRETPALQILGHRIVWSLLFLALVISWRREWEPFKFALKAPGTLTVAFIAAGLLGVNWLTYIYGVNSGFIVETSLGYFINPLVSVLMGVVFLREKLRPLQWLPVGLAMAGVLYLTFSYGALPWIALVLAFTFGLYGLVKKTARLGSLYGLTLETAALFLPALIYLATMEGLGRGAFGHHGWVMGVLLALSGLVTALPLLLFGAAAQRINLSTLGILQYIAPTLQFLIGVFIYGEPFTPARLVGFSLIWTALAIFWLEGYRHYRK